MCIKISFHRHFKESNYNVSLDYSNHNPTSTPTSSSTKQKRHRAVKTNVDRKFLRLIYKHSPMTSSLHKLFNRNTVKVSYSCMPNLKNIISRHNKKILSQATDTYPPGKCNCRNPAECPLDQKCLSRNVVYADEVTSNNAEM